MSDAVEQTMSDVIEQIYRLVNCCKQLEEGKTGMLFEPFQPMLEKWVENILHWLGPKAGEISVEKMKERYPAVGRVNMVSETARNAAIEAVTGCHDEIMDFLVDVLDDLHVGFEQVVKLLLETCRSAATDAVNAVLGIVGCSISCACMPASAMTGIIQEIYEATVKALKKYGKASLTQYGIPEGIAKMIPWDKAEKNMKTWQKHDMRTQFPARAIVSDYATTAARDYATTAARDFFGSSTANLIQKYLPA